MTPQDRMFLDAWERKNGRPLRVLHIGNIANNAYNNAKIQRRFGIDADVLSFDYYHIMACPEWEDADFKGTIKNDMFPDWWSVDLRGFNRPRWFVQGPLDASVRYLIAKTGAKPSALQWNWLEFERWLLCRTGFLNKAARFAIHRWTGQPVALVSAPANALIMKRSARLATILATAPGIRGTRVGRRISFIGRKLSIHARTAGAMDDARHAKLMKKYASAAANEIKRQSLALDGSDVPVNLAWLYRFWHHPYLRLLFSRYDIIQCYATYTAMPFAMGNMNYIAYEHGTIRAIPFQQTDEGRLCAATYRAAAAVLVTNTDNLDAAARLKFEPGKTICLPHAFDSDKLVAFQKAAATRPANDRVVFLTPARQHWVDQDPGWAKGNDRVFAALRMVKDAGHHCVLQAVAWGKDLDASKSRIAELGIENMVEWIAAMKKRELWTTYLKSHAVIDQFVVPAMGGVTFEAMMLGRRIISSIDDEQAKVFFGAAPPLFNCQTSAQIADAITKVILDPDDKHGGGQSNQDWMENYHSATRIVSIQLKAYQAMLDKKQARA